MAKDTINMNTIAIIAVVILALLAAKEFGYIGAAADGVPAPPGGGGIDILAQLPSFNEPTVTLRAYDLYKPTTTSTTEGARLYKDGVRDANVSMNGGTFSASPGQNIRLYVGDNDETGAVYTQKLSPTIPDQPDVPLRADVCTIDTGITVTRLDKYGQVSTPAANSWSIGSGETYTGKIMIQTAADKCYGNPNVGIDNVMCFKGNTTMYKSISLDGRPTVSQPTVLATNNSGTHTAWCYTWPKIADNAIFENAVTVEAKSSKNPTATDDIHLAIDDAGLTLNADTDKEIEGYEDEAGNKVGDTAEINTQAPIPVS